MATIGNIREVCKKLNVTAQLEQISEPWRPIVVGRLNGQEVKLAKFRGQFVWHDHAEEDELFFGIRGRFQIEFRDRTVTSALLNPDFLD